MINAEDALGTEQQAVREVEHDGQPARAVEGSRLYRTDIDDLWDALTSPERIPRWFAPVEGDLALGGRYQIEGNAQGTIRRCEPPRRFELTWEFGPSVSWVDVRLAPEGDGEATRLTLVHTMLQHEASEAHWASYGPGATGVGWDLAFLGMGLHTESRHVVEPEDSLAWMGTDAGKVFIRACAATWGEAHIRGGEDAEIARAMAERTARFYCGE